MKLAKIIFIPLPLSFQPKKIYNKNMLDNLLNRNVFDTFSRFLLHHTTSTGSWLKLAPFINLQRDIEQFKSFPLLFLSVLILVL